MLCALLDQAKKTDAAARVARDNLSRYLHAVLERKLPAGTLIDLRQRNIPAYTRTLKVVAGNARGTHLFRIERIRNVEANASQPTLTYWSCEATPLSEKTGDPMPATAGSGPHRQTVTLRGLITNMVSFLDADQGEMRQFLQDFGPSLEHLKETSNAHGS